RTADARTERRLVVQAVRSAHPRRPRAVVAGNQAALSFTSFPVPCEHERAWIVVHCRIRLRWIQLRILVTAGDGWDRELIPHPVVEDELVVEPPVILPIEPVVRVDLLQVANRFGSPFVGITEQERGERTAAGVREVRDTGNTRLKEAESGPAADVLLAEAVGLLTIVGEAGLDRVRGLRERQIILDGESRLLGAVVGRTAPRRQLRELDRAHVLVAVHGVRNADALLPVLIDVGREGI